MSNKSEMRDELRRLIIAYDRSGNLSTDEAESLFEDLNAGRSARKRRRRMDGLIPISAAVSQAALISILGDCAAQMLRIYLWATRRNDLNFGRQTNADGSYAKLVSWKMVFQIADAQAPPTTQI